jgi:hypothetical protein
MAWKPLKNKEPIKIMKALKKPERCKGCGAKVKFASVAHEQVTCLECVRSQAWRNIVSQSKFQHR